MQMHRLDRAERSAAHRLDFPHLGIEDSGVRTVMVTGDAPATAAIVAHAVGLEGAVCPPGPIPEASQASKISRSSQASFRKENLTSSRHSRKTGTRSGCAAMAPTMRPALRQAQIGIAVSTATDVAKSAAGVVLTEAGLGGIVAAVKEGRVTFQRILTYTLNSVLKKIVQVLLLAIGLVMTGHAVLTPMLMVIVMITGDFLAMSLTTDRVRPSAMPNSWQIGRITSAGVVLGVCFLAFCTASCCLENLNCTRNRGTANSFVSSRSCMAAKRRFTPYGNAATSGDCARAMAHIAPRWLTYLSSRRWQLYGIAMAPLPFPVLAGEFAATIAFGLFLDGVKIPLFNLLKIS